MATGIAAIAILAMTGLAIDLGRMYVAKNEAQTYTDMAALSGALRLNGTLTGFTDARNAVTASTNAWNFGHGTFTGTVVEFSQNSAGPWEANPATAANYLFIRVTGDVDVPLTFMKAVASGDSRDVAASAVAGQIELTTVREGACPFAPLAHDPTDPINFGLIPGEEYTLHWPAEPSLDKKLKKMPCDGDNTQEMMDMSQLGGSQYRGFIISSAASELAEIVMYDRQDRVLNVGDDVDATEGGTVSVRTAIQDRVLDDPDPAAANYWDYVSRNGRGPSRRIMSCPVTTWNPGASTYKIIGFRKFFLYPRETYLPNKTEAWCGEYVSNAWLQGSENPGAGSPGHYIVRLVR